MRFASWQQSRRCLLLVHRDCLDLAGILAGTLTADDRSIGADLCASSALLTLGLVNMSYVLMIKGDGTKFTYVLATVCKTATAGIGNLITADGAFVTSNFDIFLQFVTIPQRLGFLLCTVVTISVLIVLCHMSVAEKEAENRQIL